MTTISIFRAGPRRRAWILRSLVRTAWFCSAMAMMGFPLEADAEATGVRMVGRSGYSSICFNSVGDSLMTAYDKNFNAWVLFESHFEQLAVVIVKVKNADSILFRWLDDAHAQVKLCGPSKVPGDLHVAQVGQITVSFPACPSVRTRAPLLACDTGKARPLTDDSLSEWRKMEKTIYSEEGIK